MFSSEWATSLLLAGAIALSWNSFLAIFAQKGLPLGLGSLVPSIAAAVAISACSLLFARCGPWQAAAWLALSFVLSTALLPKGNSAPAVIAAALCLGLELALEQALPPWQSPV